MVPALVVLALALVASWWGTGLVRRFALARALLDIPNERSSHSTPTPRGGGVAIVLVVLAGILVGAAGGWVRGSVAIALVPSGMAVALVSWIDDRRSVPRRIRFLVHLAAAAWVVYCFGPAPLGLGLLDGVVTVLGIAWMANLYNFMDGIDGLAVGETLTVGLALALFCWRAGDMEPAWLAALLAVAAAGFLPWNWHPARIFLGDVGSVFLGFTLASLGLLIVQRGDLPAPGWLVLAGVFVFDATVTLLRRMARGERWFVAHRSHAYQRAVQAGLSHARVTTLVMGVNGVLALLVCGAVAWPRWAVPVWGLALLLLASLYWLAGRLRPM